jgi:hypothetical protein
LRFPQGLRQNFEHPMFGFVRAARPGGEFRVQFRDAGRTVGRDLLANGEMQTHVQPGIELARAG